MTKNSFVVLNITTPSHSEGAVLATEEFLHPKLEILCYAQNDMTVQGDPSLLLEGQLDGLRFYAPL